jgi:large subunit ribosomal protein L24
MAKTFKIKKGDRVTVITGRDKGKKGEVLRVMRKENRVLVQGVNMVKRHQAPTQANTGGIIDKEASLHISNVALIDPKSDLPTRVGYRLEKGGRKVRIARRSGEAIDL